MADHWQEPLHAVLEQGLVLSSVARILRLQPVQTLPFLAHRQAQIFRRLSTVEEIPGGLSRNPPVERSSGNR